MDASPNMVDAPVLRQGDKGRHAFRMWVWRRRNKSLACGFTSEDVIVKDEEGKLCLSGEGKRHLQAWSLLEEDFDVAVALVLSRGRQRCASASSASCGF